MLSADSTILHSLWCSLRSVATLIACEGSNDVRLYRSSKSASSIKHVMQKKGNGNNQTPQLKTKKTIEVILKPNHTFQGSTFPRFTPNTKSFRMTPAIATRKRIQSKIKYILAFNFTVFKLPLSVWIAIALRRKHLNRDFLAFVKGSKIKQVVAFSATRRHQLI